MAVESFNVICTRLVCCFQSVWTLIFMLTFPLQKESLAHQFSVKWKENHLYELSSHIVYYWSLDDQGFTVCSWLKHIHQTLISLSLPTLYNHVIAAESKATKYLTFQVPNLSNPEFVEDIFLLPRSKDKQVCQTVFLKWCYMVTIVNFVFGTKLVNQEVYL